MTSWIPMNGRRPPKTANGHASMVFDEGRDELLLVIPQHGVDVWAWRFADRPFADRQFADKRGSDWHQIASGLMGQVPNSRPLVAFGKGDTHIFLPTEGKMHVCRLSEPDQIQVIDVPELQRRSYNHGTAGFDEDSGRFLIHVTDYQGGTTYSFDGDSTDCASISKLVDGPALMSGCWDEASGRLVGVDIQDTLHAFDGTVWTVIHAERLPTSSDIGFDPASGRIFRLVGHSEEEMRLYEFAGDGWQPTQRSMRPLMASAVVGVDKKRGQLVSYGGQDFRKSGSWSDETWTSDGADFDSASSEADRIELGRHTSPVVFDGKLVAINHSTLAADALGPGGWEVVCDPIGDDDPDLGPLRHSRLYDLSVNFAAGEDTLYMLDGDGALWTSRPGAKWREVAAPDAGPSGHYARRVSMGWDSVHARLVVFGGAEANTTWVFEDGTWREFDDEVRPAHGVGSLAATPQGLYLLAGADLWLLEEDRWRCVGTDSDWRGIHLRYDPNRQLLLSVSQAGSWRLAAWLDGRWQELGDLPDELRLATLYGNGAEIGVDPQGDRLVALGESMFWALDLSTCPLSSDQLAADNLPTEEREPQDATRPAPADALFEAVALITTDGPTRNARELGLDLVIPRDWRLIATVPSHPVASALEGFGGMAVLMHPEWWSQDFEPWRLGGGGLEVVLLAEEPPLYLADPYDDDMMVPAEMVPFKELSPDLQTVYNTPRGAQLEQAFGTKLGGHPSYIQGDVLEYYEADDHPQFVMQLRADVFDCLFGDFGAAYVFVNEHGEGKAVMQSH